MANKSAFTVLDENAISPEQAKRLGIEASQVPGGMGKTTVSRPKGSINAMRANNAQNNAATVERSAYNNSQDTVVYTPEVVTQNVPKQPAQRVVPAKPAAQPAPQQAFTIQEDITPDESPMMPQGVTVADTVEEEPIVEGVEVLDSYTEEELADINSGAGSDIVDEPEEENMEEEEDTVEENNIVEETPVEEEVDEEVMEEPAIEEPAKPVDTSVRDENAVDIEVTSAVIEDEEKDDDLDVEVATEDNTDTDKVMVSLQRQVTEKMRPVLHKRDLTGFTVATQPIAINSVVETKEVSVAKWPLSATGITVQGRTLLGSDLEDLRSLMQQQDYRGILQKIYDAIVSPKPAFNIWVKSIAYTDYDDLFMLLYIAAFKGSNYMPVDCTGAKCPEKTYITDDIPFSRMVKYKDEESKEKFQKLYKTAPADNYGLTPTEIVPVSENFAIGFVIPSLYAVLLEGDYYDAEFRRKYGTAIAVAPYVDKFYHIDYANKKYVPVDFKKYDNNDAKTCKSKIITYNKILRTFTSDEINALKAYMEAINTKDRLVTYIMPATTCPHCGAENAETEARAQSLLFLRNQLAALVNTSEN